MNLKELVTSHLPSYTCTLPYSKIKTKFRPFLVKEEKKLLILEETSTQKEIYQGIIEVLNSCYENIDFNKIPLFEVEYCFLKLRSKSIGENLNPKIKCPVTGENHVVNIDLADVKFIESPIENTIKIDKNLSIQFKYPTVNDIIEESEDINTMVANCIAYIETPDEKADGSSFSKDELVFFLNHLTPKAYDQILNFFDKMPRSELDANYRTTDGISRTIKLKGLKDFFS